MTISSTIYVLCFVFCDILLQVCGEYCPEYGHTCPRTQRCCQRTCCLDDNYRNGYGFKLSIWNMWYFWFIVIFILMSCFGGCGYWRRRQLMLHQQQSMLQHQQAYNHYITQAAYGVPSLSVPINSSSYNAGTLPNGATQAEGTFPSPPAYNEVVTKPYVYPPSKDELPPYPGEYAPAYGILNGNDAQADTTTSVGPVPGLPPYSVLPPDAVPAQNSQSTQQQAASPAFSAQVPSTGEDANPPPPVSPAPDSTAPPDPVPLTVNLPPQDTSSSDVRPGVLSSSENPSVR